MLCFPPVCFPTAPQLVVMARVVVKDPMTAIIPLVVLVCLLAFGLWGVFSVAYALRDGRRQAAINAAQDLSQTLTRCGCNNFNQCIHWLFFELYFLQ